MKLETTGALDRHLECVLIVLSAGRTGTKALAHVLNEAFDGARALHEPRPSWRLRIASNAYLAGARSDEQMIRTFISLRRHLLAHISEPVYVESNGLLNGFLDVLPKVFDRPRVLHLLRDPRTYVTSALNFGTRSGLKRLASDWLPYWILKPEHLERRPAKTWRQMSDIERFSWFWRTTNLHLERGETLLGGHYRRLRFEDLMTTDGSEIRKVAAWLGLRERSGVLEQLISIKVNAAHSHEVPDFSDWPREDRRSLRDYCEDLMVRYGYGESGRAIPK